MSDAILWVSIAILILAVVLAIFLPLWMGRKVSPTNTPSEARFNELLRAEGDQTRRTVGEEMRDQRQELTTNLSDFRRELLEELKGFREAVGTKLDSELKRLGDEATANRDKLRETISGRLDEQSVAQLKAGRELREEVTGSVQKLQEGVLNVAAEQRAAQETQFEGFGKRLTLATDGLNTVMTTLTASLEEKHVTLLATVDGKLVQVAETLAKGGVELREEVNGIFQVLGDTITKTINQMSEHQKERLAAVDQTMLQLSQKHQEAGETLKAVVEEKLVALQVSNAAKLDEIRKTVDEQLQQTLQERLTASFKLVSDQLEQVYRGLGEMQKLADGVGDLKRVLANVKTRGIYGEVQLGALMEQMFAPAQYVKNAQVKKNSQERVEYALRIPGPDSEEDALLPIDSKFPIEDYERLRDAASRADLAAIETAEANLESRIRSFAKDIGDKYVNPPMTTDIAILFLPTEGLYAEAIRRVGLAESLLEKHRVTIAGPTTLLAMLSGFRMALRAVAVQKRSAEVWNVLSAVKTEFGNYGSVVVKLQGQLEKSLDTVNALGTRTRVMNRKLGDVEGVAMDPVDAQKLLGVTADPADAN